MQQLCKCSLFSAVFAMLWLPLVSQAATPVPSGSYSVDPTHGYINLNYSHLGFSRPTIRVTGFQADLTYDAEKLENSKVNVNMESKSLDSGVEKFDDHLYDEKFFDVAKYPAITFASTAVEEKGEGKLAIAGDLTVKGVTKPVTLDATLNKAAMNPIKKIPALGFSATTTIKRSEWGLGEYAPMVSDDVEIQIEIEFFHNK